MFKTKEKEKPAQKDGQIPTGPEAGEPAGVKIIESESAPAINPNMLTNDTIIGDKIKDRSGKTLGKIQEVTIDLTRGKVLYLVLSVGGFLGIGDKFFAIPLNVLTLDVKDKTFHLDVDGKKFKKLDGFDKLDWPRKAQWPPDSQEDE